MQPDPQAQTLPEPSTASAEQPSRPRRRDLVKDLVGRVLKQQYRVEALLGQGAMGVVFRGVQLALDKPVAIKMMRPDVFHSADSLERFEREAQLVSKIIHPSIAQVLDYGVDDDMPFLVMEFVDGKELTEVLEIEGPMPAARAIAILRQLASALGEAHKHGVVHRDVKPHNLRLMRYQRGGQIFLKVLDFGVAKHVGDGSASAAEQGKLTATGAVIGTPMYMAPEQAGGQKVDARADQYAAGIVLYELLTGTVPFTGETLTGVLVSHLTKPPPPLPRQIPDALQKVVLRLLSKKPDERFPDMAAFERALEAAELVCRDVPALTPGKVEPLGAGRPVAGSGEWRRTVALGGGAILLAGGVLVTALLVGPRLRHRTPGPQPTDAALPAGTQAVPPVEKPASPPATPQVTPPPETPKPPVTVAAAKPETKPETKPSVPKPAAPSVSSKESPAAQEKLDEAERLLKGGDFRSAVDSARRSLADGQSARAYRLIANAYCQMGDLGNAKASFHRVAAADRRAIVALCKKNDIDLP